MGAGSLKILTGVLFHRVARPLPWQCFVWYTGWSVPCVSIQLTLSQHFCCVAVFRVVGSGWSVPCVSIQLILSQQTEWHDRCMAVFRVVVAGRYLVCRFN